MELKLTKELENLIKYRGGEKYILKCIAYYIGNIEMVSLYEYNHVANMKVSVYDTTALWQNGYSPFDKLIGCSYSELKKVGK